MKTHFKKLMRFFFGVVYVLCLGEVFVRVFAPQAIMPRYVTAAPYGIRANIAGARYRHYTQDVNVEYRINSAGFRADTEYQRAKPDGTCRVLMFGDSFMMGYEVSLEDSIPYVLQELLADAGKPCEVINMSVSGYGTAEMLVSLERNGLAYGPDIVVFQWHRTDYQDNVRSGLYRLADNQLERNRAEYLPSIAIQDFLQKIPVYRFVIQYSQLYSAARESLAVQVKRFLAQIRQEAIFEVENETIDVVDDDSVTPPAASKSGDYAARLGASLLLHAAQLAEAHNARFYVLDIPEERRGGHVQSTLARINPDDIGDLQIARLDERLNSMRDKGLQIFYKHGHGHFTPLGYYTAADELFELIINDLSSAAQPGSGD